MGMLEDRKGADAGITSRRVEMRSRFLCRLESWFGMREMKRIWHLNGLQTVLGWNFAFEEVYRRDGVRACLGEIV